MQLLHLFPCLDRAWTLPMEVTGQLLENLLGYELLVHFVRILDGHMQLGWSLSTLLIGHTCHWWPSYPWSSTRLRVEAHWAPSPWLHSAPWSLVAFSPETRAGRLPDFYSRWTDSSRRMVASKGILLLQFSQVDCTPAGVLFPVEFRTEIGLVFFLWFKVHTVLLLPGQLIIGVSHQVSAEFQSTDKHYGVLSLKDLILLSIYWQNSSFYMFSTTLLPLSCSLCTCPSLGPFLSCFCSAVYAWCLLEPTRTLHTVFSLAAISVFFTWDS